MGKNLIYLQTVASDSDSQVKELDRIQLVRALPAPMYRRDERLAKASIIFNDENMLKILFDNAFKRDQEQTDSQLLLQSFLLRGIFNMIRNDGKQFIARLSACPQLFRRIVAALRNLTSKDPQPKT